MCATCATSVGPVARPLMTELTELKLTEQGGTTSDLALLSWARGRRQGNGAMVLVAPGLYLGNKQAGADYARLQRAGIVAVCAVGAKPGTAPCVYHHVRVKDDGVSSTLPFLDSACDFIHQQRQRGAVLVHCKGGINRSPCLVVAYLMKYEQLALAEALELCSLARPVARCPSNFHSDLKAFELHLAQTAAAEQTAEAVQEIQGAAQQAYGSSGPTESSEDTDPTGFSGSNCNMGTCKSIGKSIARASGGPGVRNPETTT